MHIRTRGSIIVVILSVIYSVACSSDSSVATPRNNFTTADVAKLKWIEGTWRGLSWYPNHHQWYEFTLEIKRVEGSATGLTGSILAHYWDGPADNWEPPSPCYGERLKIHMPAEGSYDAGKVVFGGTKVELQDEICGHFDGNYLVDIFKGDLDPAINEFNSINDWDAGSSYHEPTVFRRIACPKQSELRERKDGDDVTPPPFYPKQKAKPAAGC